MQEFAHGTSEVGFMSNKSKIRQKFFIKDLTAKIIARIFPIIVLWPIKPIMAEYRPIEKRFKEQKGFTTVDSFVVKYCQI